LSDPNLLDLYRKQDARLTATRVQLLQHQHSAAARQPLTELGNLQKDIGLTVTAMQAGKASANTTGLSRRFTELAALADRVAEQSNAQIDTEVDALETQTQQARRRLLWQAALLVPLTII